MLLHKPHPLAARSALMLQQKTGTFLPPIPAGMDIALLTSVCRRRVSAWAMRAMAHFWQIGRLESPGNPGPVALERLLLWLCSYR